jgi:GNAT superfamily N-acetyltransferase
LQDIEISGYYPGVVGKITEIHGVYYHENWGFDVSFETQVGQELSEFVGQLDEDRDGLWVATKKGKFAGAIAIEGQNAFTDGARLRWFIVVPEFQESGIGKELILRAVEFCKRKRFPYVYLWTFEGLTKARRLYEAVNFKLCEENEIAQWGQIIKEQKFELELPGS